jgi:hypothetical protein
MGCTVRFATFLFELSAGCLLLQQPESELSQTKATTWVPQLKDAPILLSPHLEDLLRFKMYTIPCHSWKVLISIFIFNNIA